MTGDPDVGKWWAVLFGVVMLACGLHFATAPLFGWWLPDGVSTHAADIDRLFYIILAITGFFFILTEAMQVYLMFRYAGGPDHKTAPEPDHTAHDFERKLEIGWTIVPSVILLYIAFAQVGTWVEAKDKSRQPAVADGEKKPVVAAISARQFEWRMRYPSSATLEGWKQLDAKKREKAVKDWSDRWHIDDLHVVNELHVVKNRPVLVYVSTKDVIHSFNIPHMRVKQDALPGKVIPVWFTPTHSNTVKGTDRWQDGGGFDDTGRVKDKNLVWSIACAELCGRDHGRMIGKLFVHDSEPDWTAWLSYAEQGQRATAEVADRKK
jgi:cytochrome c oxidase subunit 2